jgi:CRISPR-associated protein Cmr3
MNSTPHRTFVLSPVDAWFFRDGRPYNAGEANQSDVASVFPPPATTLVGALRAALARSRNWTGTGNWNNVPSCPEVLGRNFDDLGSLRFHGPWLLQHNTNATDLLVPLPLHVLGREVRSAQPHGHTDWQPQCLLTPDTALTPTDLGNVRLPIASAVRTANFQSAGLKPPSTHWITLAGLQQIQNGQLPDSVHIRKSSDLFAEERRVALARSAANRTTQDGDLYSPAFIRLHRGVAIAMSISGLPSDWHVPQLLPLGGEGRLADCRELPLERRSHDLFNLRWPDAATPNPPQQVTVTLVTPMLPHDHPESLSGEVQLPKPGESFFGCEGTTVVSACVGKPQFLGGWDSLERRPLPLRPVLPAGSTWFLEIHDPAPLQQLLSRGLGLKTAYGFGQAIVGEWPQHQQSSP